VNTNIGDFAEALMDAEIHSKNKQEAILEATSPAKTPDGQVDITHVNVPNSFVNEVLGTPSPFEDDQDRPAPVVQTEVPFSPGLETGVEEVPSEDNVISEIREIKTLLSELKSLYSELTTVGSLGVNMGAKSAACDPFKEEQEQEERVHARIKKILKKRRK